MTPIEALRFEIRGLRNERTDAGRMFAASRAEGILDTIPDDAELVERLEDLARTLDRSTANLAKGRYSRVYEAVFRTAVEAREIAKRLKARARA